MRIRRVVAVTLALSVFSIQMSLAYDYEMTSNHPGGAFVEAVQAHWYVQGRPHTPNSGIAFRFNHAIKGATIKAYAGWSTGNPPGSWLYSTAQYSDGTTETVPCDNSAWEYKQDGASNWYYCYYMTNWFTAPVAAVITQVFVISANSNQYADVCGLFYIDTDGDKLFDLQEIYQTKTDTNLWDTDGDGLSDGEEVRTATNPTNPLSYFSITAMTNSGGGSVDFTFSWPATNYKSYRLERFFDPVSLACTTEQEGISGVFPTNVLNVSASTLWTSCFYRVMQTTDSVTGRNAVGYVKIVGERDKLTLGCSDFEDMTSSGGVTVSTLFGDQLPANSTLYLWDRSTASYKTLAKTVRGGWGAAGTTRVARGGGFWIRVSATAVSNEYPVCLMGQIPDRITAPSTVVQNITGDNMFGYPYPVQEKWTNTDMAKKAPINSSLYLWDQSNQTYIIFARTARGGWGPASNVVMYLGQGFWLRNTGTFDCVESKPYTWP